MRALRFSVPLPWPELLERTAVEIYTGNCFSWAATLAYYAFLALFPALLFVVALAGVVPVQPLIDRIVATLARVAPLEVAAVAREQLRAVASRPSATLLVLSLVGAAWSMSSGMAALIDALNQVYRVTDRRPWWRVRVRAILLTLTLTAATVAAFGLVLVGPAAAEHVAGWFGLGPLVVWTWDIARWPVAGLLVVTALGCIYQFAPDTTREWAWISPGSVTATVLWLLVSIAFKWYVRHLGGYQPTYGAIGGVIVTLLWFYFISLAILLGAQLEATIAHASADPRAPAVAGATTPIEPAGAGPR